MWGVEKVIFMYNNGNKELKAVTTIYFLLEVLQENYRKTSYDFPYSQHRGVHPSSTNGHHVGTVKASWHDRAEHGRQ